MPGRMAAAQATERVAPTQVREGDVIADEPGKRWLTVTEVQTLPGPDGGVYIFYRDGPQDRVTFGAGERVPRKRK